jgi:cytochrome c556
MSKTVFRFLFFVLACGLSAFVIADEDPREQRHELMEGVGDAAKPVGGMLKGEVAFDNPTLMKSLQTMLEASNEFGALFPPGSEGGEDSRAAAAIWSDRAGFDAALAKFHDAVGAAIAADPQSLDDARPAVGPVFNACKNCHDSYRLEKD